MNPLDKITVGVTGEKDTIVTPDLTVGHFVPGMPLVYGTPLMIMLMEITAGGSIASLLPAGWVSVGTEVNIRHLAATPVGRTVRATSRVISLGPASVEFAVEAWDGTRKIGDGTHRRGVVEIAAFEKRFGVKKA